MKNVLLLLTCIAVLAFSCDKQKSAVVPPVDTTVTNNCELRVIHATVFLKKEYVKDFISSAKAMVDSSNLEEGCISYQLYQDPYDETKFIFVEVWKDQASIEAHFQMPYFVAWGPKTADWYAGTTGLSIFNASKQQ